MRLTTTNKRASGADNNLELKLDFSGPAPGVRAPLEQDLKDFKAFGTATRCEFTEVEDTGGQAHRVPTYVNEFWTARQRQAHSLHEISYRACFKPQLPRFFIERLTRRGDVVYDPFAGRGTTLLESALMGRIPYGCDINPLSQIMIRPRLQPPFLEAVAERLKEIPLDAGDMGREELLVFFHPDTLKAILALREYLLGRVAERKIDAVDEWIWLVALNRLTGHSKGFFSVYTLPPNQAVSIKSQARINERRRQKPEPRDVRAIILKKTRILLGDCTAADRQVLEQVRPHSRMVTAPASSTPEIPSGSVALVVTSPPFLNVVQYATDNWLRCWFLGVDAESVEITMARRLDAWQEAMNEVFRELRRVLRPGGHVAFEVGEVHRGETKLEEAVVRCVVEAGLEPVLVMINDQEFTKTANCWGVDNMGKGTNTNRIVVLRKG